MTEPTPAGRVDGLVTWRGRPRRAYRYAATGVVWFQLDAARRRAGARVARSFRVLPVWGTP